MYANVSRSAAVTLNCEPYHLQRCTILDYKEFLPKGKLEAVQKYVSYDYICLDRATEALCALCCWDKKLKEESAPDLAIR